ncbi:MAG: sugar ABC transporter permease [Saccharofermentans sp.]|nr:sugar ABC transporter permease [Saccharofermentans sp.]
MGENKTAVFLKKYAMIIVLFCVLGLFTGLTGGNILLPMNITSLISQNAYVFILAAGMLLCILTGGNIDLSVGSIVCFTGAIGATLMVKQGWNPVLAVIAMAIVGALIGAFQAFWIAYVRIPPFIVTLAGMLAFRGLSNVVLDATSIPLSEETGFLKVFGGGRECYVPDVFGIEGFNLTCFLIGVIATVIYIILQIKSRVARKKKGYEAEKMSAFLLKIIPVAAAIMWIITELSLDRGFPTVLIWIMAVVLIYGYITSNTVTGRTFYAVGGNEKATKLSGINTNKVYFLAYTNMGLLSAVAAMVTMARLSSAQPTAGNQYEMDAIGACFIGGASAYGGIGTVPGVIIGAILMGVINMGMFLLGVSQDWCKVVKGAVLLAAVIFDVVSKRGGKLIAKN